MSSEPHRIGPYRLEGVIGRGGMGVVHRAFDERLRRWVAAKRVDVESSDPLRRKRLRREARTAAQLAHPAIVQIFDLVEEEDCDWIVMELVEGTSLSAVTSRRRRLDVETVLSYGRQIAEGLAAAHEGGVVHRDLKTENILVLADGRVKILDFGLAKRIFAGGEGMAGAESALSRPGHVLGTTRAMSPEQARGRPVGPASDLFSFGILLYEVLTGESPFQADGVYDTLNRIVTHQPPPVSELVPEVPDELSQLVGQLLEKDPELRPRSTRAMARALERIAEEQRYLAREGSHDGPRPSGGTRTEGWIELPPASGESYATSVGLAVEPSDAGGQGAARDPTPRPADPIPTARPSPQGMANPAPSGSAAPPPTLFEIPTARSGRAWLTVAAAVAMTAALLWLLVSLGGQREALTGDDPTTTATPTPVDDPLSLYEEGLRAVRRSDRPESVERAREIFERLLASDPSSAAAHAGLARVYWERARNPATGGDPTLLDRAEDEARTAQHLDPYLADARVSLGLVQLQRGKPEEAELQLGNALELDPTNADAHFGLGKLAESRGRTEAAEQHYRQAIESQPASLFHDALGALYYRGGRYEEAEEVFLASVALAPDNVYALRNLGALYYAQGRSAEAATQIQAALKIRPDPSLYANLGTILFSRGSYSRAAAAFEKALSMARASSHPTYWLNLADTYRQIPGRQQEAVETYRRAIELLDREITSAPDDARLLSRRALAHARSGALNRARADLGRALEARGTGDVYTLLRLAVVHELGARREQALAILEQALDEGLAPSEAELEPDLAELRADPRFERLAARFIQGG